MALADAVPFAVAAWALNEASGTRFDDVGSNDLVATVSLASATGMFGSAADFERSNNEILTIDDNSDLSTGDVQFLFRAWVKLESTPGTMSIAGKWESSGQREWLLYYDSSVSRFRFIVSSNGTAVGATATANNLGAPSTGVWYLIHAWHDSVANEIGIAVNAGTADTVSYSSGSINGTSRFQMGRNDGSTNYYDGLIDDAVFIKGYILDATERTADYNSGTGVAFADWAATGEVSTVTTHRKRSSSILFDLPFGRPLPPPNGFVGKADRYQLAGKYPRFEDVFFRGSLNIEILSESESTPLSTEGGGNLEFLLAQAKDLNSNSEFLTSNNIFVQNNIESLIGLSLNFHYNLETLNTLVSTEDGNQENLISEQSSRSTGVEYLFFSYISLKSDAESLIKLSSDDGLITETLLGINFNSDTDLEILSAVVYTPVSVDGLLVIEFLVQSSSTAKSPMESTVGTTGSSRGLLENIIGLSNFGAVSEENLLGITLSRTQSSESLIGVSHDGSSYLEHLILFESNSTQILENLIAGASSSVISLEELMSVTDGEYVLTEFGISGEVSSVSISNIEILNTSIQTKVWEWIPLERDRTWTLSERTRIWVISTRPGDYTLGR